MTRKEIEQYADDNDVQIVYHPHSKKYEIGIEGELYKNNLTWLQVKKVLATEIEQMKAWRTVI